MSILLRHTVVAQQRPHRRQDSFFGYGASSCEASVAQVLAYNSLSRMASADRLQQENEALRGEIEELRRQRAGASSSEPSTPQPDFRVEGNSNAMGDSISERGSQRWGDAHSRPSPAGTPSGLAGSRLSWQQGAGSPPHPSATMHGNVPPYAVYPQMPQMGYPMPPGVRFPFSSFSPWRTCVILRVQTRVSCEC